MKKKRKCCLCGSVLPTGDYGNNPEPIKSFSEGTCCNKCNITKVLPARLKEIKNVNTNTNTDER